MDRPTRPTHADVARLANVSTATVSYVLNQSAGRRISEGTRDAVYRAAEQLGYRPNVAARNLARGKSGVVLYIVPRIAVGDMPIQAGSLMTTQLAPLGLLQLQIFETDDDRPIIDAVQNLDPIAVACMLPLSTGARLAVQRANVPYVEIGTLPALGDPHLMIGALRVEHLVARGHRKIAFAHSGISKWRALGEFWLEGVAAAARARDLPPISVGTVTMENAATTVAQWRREGVTAVCAQSDDVAFLVLHGMREAGLACPGDLAVMGVDANPMGDISSPPLTTVVFNPVAVADAAIAAILTELGLPASDSPRPSDIAQVLVRAST